MNPGTLIPMTESEVKFWHQEIIASEKRMQDEFIKRINYKELVEYYEGIQKGRSASIDTLVVIDELSPSINSIIKTAYYQNPSVQVKSGSPLADGMVKPNLLYLLQHPEFKPFSLTSLMEGAIKWGMKEGGAKDAMQVCTFDMLTAGFTVCEVNIEAKSYGQSQSQPIEQSQPGLIEQGISKVKDLFGIKDSQTTEETEEKIASEQSEECAGIKGTTYWNRWQPDHILFDSRANVFKESRFIGKVVYKSIADFKLMYPDFKDSALPAADKLSNISYSENKDRKDGKGLAIYELQIKKVDPATGEQYIQVLTLAKGISQALDSYSLPFVTNGFTLKYGSLDKYGKIYPMSRAKKGKKSQDDYNNLLTIQMEHALRANRKIAYDKSAFDADGQSALKNSDVFALVPKNRPTAAFEPIPISNVTVDNPELQGALRENINKQVGSNEIAKSGQSENKLATQDQLEHQSFEVQVSQVQDALGDLADECVDCQKDIIQQTWDDEIYFKVTGIAGATSWYDPAMGSIADIAIGDYLTTVDIVSASKPNPMKSRSDAMELAMFITNPVIQQYMGMRGKTTNMEPINNVLKQFDHDPDTIIEDLQPLPQIPPSPTHTEQSPSNEADGSGSAAPQLTPVPQAPQVANAK